jgi:hypothetical protein
MINQLINWPELSEQQKKIALARPAIADSALLSTQVTNIISQVKNQGDKAIYALTEQFDGIALDTLKVSPKQVAQAKLALSAKRLKAINTAYQQIRAFQCCLVRLLCATVISRCINASGAAGSDLDARDASCLVQARCVIHNNAVPAAIFKAVVETFIDAFEQAIRRTLFCAKLVASSILMPSQPPSLKPLLKPSLTPSNKPSGEPSYVPSSLRHP